VSDRRAPSSAEVVPPVLVVGDVMADVLVTPAGPVAIGSDTPSQVRFGGGGSGANVAVWLAALGVRTAFAGCVGEDIAGRLAADLLLAGAVDARLVAAADTPTGTCVVLVGPDGERTMLPDRGANDALAEADLPRDLFVPGHHLHVSGYTLLGDGSRAAGRAALARAAMAGMTVSATTSSAAPLAAAGVDTFLGWVSGIDLLVANLDEARVLTGEHDPRAAAAALAAHVREVVVTCGAEGAVWADGLVVATAAAARVDVTDTTGAGDAFTAGFLAEWLLHPEPETALAAGNRLAATAVSRPGARP
jgi:sugar/nucleoside kinase (ribokinase family)